MSGQLVHRRTHVVVAVSVLALGLGGVAVAQHRSGAAQVNVTILDGGKLTVSPTSFTAGKVTLVVVNKGRLTHGLAIMGLGLGATRTPTLSTGKTAQLTVTVKVGKYHVWDPVRSSMSHATMLMAKSAATGGGSTGSSGSTTSTGSSSTGSGVGGGTTGTAGAVDSTDPCDGMMHM